MSFPFLLFASQHIHFLCSHGSYCLFYTPLSTMFTHTPIIRIFITCCSRLGEEVALYCSKYLPDIIKEQKTYKDGKLQKVSSRSSHGMTFLTNDVGSETISFVPQYWHIQNTLWTDMNLLNLEPSVAPCHLTSTDSPFCMLFPGSGGCLLGHRQQNDHRGSHQGAGPDRWTAHWRAAYWKGGRGGWLWVHR